MCACFYGYVFQNSSSWVLYNMASFYWRMKNDPQKAVDCVVRALHFSPRYCFDCHKASALVQIERQVLLPLHLNETMLILESVQSRRSFVMHTFMTLICHLIPTYSAKTF